jgi:antitoxin component YwqK of YwqJK toxin-antitoxin module
MSTEYITEYHPNGQMKSEGRYDGCHPVGDHISWYENGNKQYESIELDESTEMTTCWHENGQKKSEGARTEHWETGLWTEWYENGNKKSEGFYKGKDERDGEWKFWHSNGQLACTGIHKGWGGDGLWVFWDEVGSKVHEREYRKFELLNVWKSLRADGCSDDLVSKYKQYIFS